MPHHPLTNFEMQNYYQRDPKFNGVYSRNNLPKIKDRVYIINLDEYKSTGTHWIASKEIINFIGNKNVRTNIYRIQAYHSIMCEYFCIRFIDFILKSKSLLDYANLFSPNDYEKNDKIILKIF